MMERATRTKLIRNGNLLAAVKKFKADHPGIDDAMIEREAGLKRFYISKAKSHADMRSDYADAIRAAMKSLAALDAATKPDIQHPSGQDIQDVLFAETAPADNSPGGNWYDLYSLGEQFKGTRKQLYAWHNRHCPPAYKVRHNGRFYIHRKALEHLDRYAQAQEWNGNRKSQSERKQPAPVADTPLPPKHRKIVKRSFWNRLRLAWDVFRSTKTMSA